MSLDIYLIPYTKTNSKWVKDLNIEAKTTKFIEGNRCKSTWPWIRLQFLRYDTKNTTKKKIIGPYQSFSFLQSIPSRKWRVTWEKIPANHICDKGLLSRIYKNSYNSMIKTNNSIKKWVKDLNRYLSKENTWLINKWKDAQHQD